MGHGASKGPEQIDKLSSKSGEVLGAEDVSRCGTTLDSIDARPNTLGVGGDVLVQDSANLGTDDPVTWDLIDGLVYVPQPPQILTEVFVVSHGAQRSTLDDAGTTGMVALTGGVSMPHEIASQELPRQLVTLRQRRCD